MPNESIIIPYKTKDGRELPITVSIPSDKIKFDKDGIATGGDEAYIKQAAEMAAKVSHPEEFDAFKPKGPNPLSVIKPVGYSDPTPRASQTPQSDGSVVSRIRDILGGERKSISIPFISPQVDQMDRALHAPISGRSTVGKIADIAGGAASMASSAALPELGGALMTAPKAIAKMLALGTAGDLAGRGISSLAGGDQDVQDLSGLAGGIVGGGISASPKLSAAARGAMIGGKLATEDLPPSAVGKAVGGYLGALGGAATSPHAPYVGGYAGAKGGADLGAKLHPIEFAKGAFEGARALASKQPWLPEFLSPKTEQAPPAAVNALTTPNAPRTPPPFMGGTGWQETTPRSSPITTPPPFQPQVSPAAQGLLADAANTPQMKMLPAPAEDTSFVKSVPGQVAQREEGWVPRTSSGAIIMPDNNSTPVKPPVAKPAVVAKITPKVSATENIAKVASERKPVQPPVVKAATAENPKLNSGEEIPPERQAPIAEKKPSESDWHLEQKKLQNVVFSLAKNREIGADFVARELGIPMDRAKQVINGLVSEGRLVRQGNTFRVPKPVGADKPPVVKAPKGGVEEIDELHKSESDIIDKIDKMSSTPNHDSSEIKKLEDEHNRVATRITELTKKGVNPSEDKPVIKVTPPGEKNAKSETPKETSNTDAKGESTKTDEHGKLKEAKSSLPKGATVEGVESHKPSIAEQKTLETERRTRANELLASLEKEDTPDPAKITELRSLHAKEGDSDPETVSIGEMATLARHNQTSISVMGRKLIDMGVKVEPSKMDVGGKYGLGLGKKQTSPAQATHLALDEDDILHQLDLLGKKPSTFTEDKGLFSRENRQKSVTSGGKIDPDVMKRLFK
jgi:hypothetical protein